MDRDQFDHYLHDETRRGPAPADAFTGAAGGAACGDVSRISLSVEDGRIAGVTFDAEGCGSTIAATAAVAEIVDGVPVLEAALVSSGDIDAPPCGVLDGAMRRLSGGAAVVGPVITAN